MPRPELRRALVSGRGGGSPWLRRIGLVVAVLVAGVLGGAVGARLGTGTPRGEAGLQVAESADAMVDAVAVAAELRTIEPVVAVEGAVARAGTTWQFVGEVPSEVLLRMPTRPDQVRVKLLGGGAPTACGQPVLGSSGEGGPVLLRCDLGSDQEVYEGLPATAGVVLGSAADVVAVPTTAVVGETGTGMVAVPDGAGGYDEIDVELGLSDGLWIELVSGLDEGEEVLDPIPVDTWWQAQGQ